MKTTWIRQNVARNDRLLVWDSKAEWHKFACRVVSSFAELSRIVLPSAKPERIAFRVPVSRENFIMFCKLAWVYCRAHGSPLVVEELADVTTPGKAPTEWGEICRKSREYGPDIYAVTQRPQEVDKTVQGNVALVHCGMMSDEVDAAYCARRLLRVPVEEVMDMKPGQWIERNTRTHDISRGVTRWTSPKLRK